MSPDFRTITQKLLLGMRINMTLANNQTSVLWQSFMPRSHEIDNRANQNLYSIQRMPSNITFKDFSPDILFEKWAAVEIMSNELIDGRNIPEGMHRTNIEAGEYAVFTHHGPAHTFPSTMNYIFGQWLPSSNYELDNRAQFEIMKPGYRPDDENAEEEVWVPIKPR
jgi:AraC family transcriptional regulator